MTKAKQTIEQDHPTALPCTWKHARWLLSGKESRNGWQEEKVKELRRMFGKGLSGHTAKYPDLIARALVEHDRALAQAIAEAVQQRCNMGETEPDF
jgi:sirohydrochlorin ferrochelatase